MYSISGFPRVAAPNKGAFIKNLLMLSKEFWHDWSHRKGASFFIIFLESWHCQAMLQMNLWMNTNFPCRLQRSHKFFGSGNFWTTSFFAGSTSIPCWHTIQSRKFRDMTPNSHLSRFIFNSNFLYLSRNNSKVLKMVFLLLRIYH